MKSRSKLSLVTYLLPRYDDDESGRRSNRRHGIGTLLHHLHSTVPLLC